jgi:hypothetical protein
VSDDHEPAFGPIETSVRADIQALGPLTSGVRRSMAVMAYGLASQLDQAYEDDASGTRIAQINKELRSTLQQVTETANDNRKADALATFLSSPEFTRAALGDASPV